MLTPNELLKKLSLLVPPPRSKQIRFHGIFAGRARARAKLRSRWVEEQLAKEAEAQAPASMRTAKEAELLGAWMPQDILPVVPAPSPWVPYVPGAELLWRTRGIGALHCPRCGGSMRPSSRVERLCREMRRVVLDPDELEKELLYSVRVAGQGREQGPPSSPYVPFPWRFRHRGRSDRRI